MQIDRQTRKERNGRIDHRNLRMSVLAFGGGAHLAAQMMRNELQAIADAEHRLAEAQQRRVGTRRVGVIDRAGSTRKNDAERFVAFNFCKLCRAWEDHGKDILLANAARDQLCVLGTKVKDDDRRGVHVPVYFEVAKVGDEFGCGALNSRHNWMNATSRATWKKSDAAR